MAILVFSPNGTYVAKPTLEAARTSADCAGKTVVVTSALTAAQSNITAAWPKDRALEVRKGGSIANSTDFTINSSFSAGRYQVFAGTGAIMGLGEIHVDWFGAQSDGSADSTNAINKAVACALKAPLHPVGDDLTERGGATLIFGSGTYLTSGLTVPYDAGNYGGQNLIIKGAGVFGTSLVKYGTAPGSMIKLVGNLLNGSVASERVAQITIHDLLIDGSFVANTYGIFINKAWRIDIHRVQVICCSKAFYFVSVSEIVLDQVIAYSNDYNLYFDGNRTIDVYGTPTLVSEKGFVENVTVRDSQFWGPRITSVYLNHVQSVKLQHNYIGINDTSAQHVVIASAGGSAGDSPTCNTILERNFFETDANAITKCWINVLNNDGVIIRDLSFSGNLVESFANNTAKFINLGVNATNPTKPILNTQIDNNTIYYTTAAMYPGILQESTLANGTVLTNNTPIGSLGGSRFNIYTTWDGFDMRLFDINTLLNSTAETLAFPGVGGTPWYSNATGSIISIASNANSYKGIKTIQIGDNVTAGSYYVQYLLDVSQYRDKVIQVSFVMKSDSIGTQFISLFPNNVSPDLCTYDTYYSRLSVEALVTAADSVWSRVSMFVPINTISSVAGTGDFGTAATATLAIRFNRDVTTATQAVFISDIQVRASNRHYAS